MKRTDHPKSESANTTHSDGTNDNSSSYDDSNNANPQQRLMPNLLLLVGHVRKERLMTILGLVIPREREKFEDDCHHNLVFNFSLNRKFYFDIYIYYVLSCIDLVLAFRAEPTRNT